MVLSLHVRPFHLSVCLADYFVCLKSQRNAQPLKLTVRLVFPAVATEQKSLYKGM
jgi:hypothetical protein